MQNVLNNRDHCMGCSSCSQRCPTQCISMLPDSEGFLVPVIDQSRCTDCGQCRKACPVYQSMENNEISITSTNPLIEPKVYAAWSLDEAIRLKSSSGGLFSVLAEDCIKKGGTVFGAAFDDDFTVHHVGITEITELDSLRRSKYVQSAIDGSYRQAETLLKKGTPVLFAGTFCQIAGLMTFLGRDYPSLLTLDMACHGAPSPKVWSLYLDQLKAQFSSDIKAISFRDKRDGWLKYCMKIDFMNGQTYSDSAFKETFFLGYGKNLFSRKSCSDCHFRYPHAKADITLADFWGIDKLSGIDVSENKGVSLLLIHTPKGEAALKKIEEDIFLQERSFKEAVTGNPRITTSCRMPKARAKFFKEINYGKSFYKIQQKYMSQSGLRQRLKRVLKSVLSPKLIDKLNKLRVL